MLTFSKASEKDHLQGQDHPSCLRPVDTLAICFRPARAYSHFGNTLSRGVDDVLSKRAWPTRNWFVRLVNGQGSDRDNVSVI